MRTDPEFVAQLDGFMAEFNGFCQGKFSSNLNHFLMQLNREDVVFDNDPHGIHFQNGRWDLRSGQFIPLYAESPFGRTPTMYITAYVPHDWVASEQTDIEAFNASMMQIFQVSDSFEYMKYYIAKCLCAESTKDCEMVINLGTGGAGKSTLLNMLTNALGPYCCPIKFTAFDDDAEFQMCFRNLAKYVRFIFVEECENIRTISNLKMLCDGNIPMRARGKNITETLDINAKVFATSNKFIYFGNDTGID